MSITFGVQLYNDYPLTLSRQVVNYVKQNENLAFVQTNILAVPIDTLRIWTVDS